MSEKLVKKLLSGKTLTGEELGKVILYSGAKDIEAKETGEPIELPREHIQNMINTFSKPDEIAFSKYIGINNFIRYAYISCLGHKEIARNRFIAIETAIADVAKYANGIRLFNTMPAVFTEKQMQDMYDKAEQHFKNWKYNIADLICAYIGHQIDIEYTEGRNETFNNIMKSYKDVAIPADFKEIINILWCDYEQYNITDAPYPLKTKADLIDALRYRNIKPLRKYTKKELAEPLTYEYIEKMTPKEEMEQIKVTKHTGEANKIKTLYDFLDNVTFKDVCTLKSNDIDIKDLLQRHFKDLHDYALSEIRATKGLDVFANATQDAFITLPELARADVFGYKAFYDDKVAQLYGYKGRGFTIMQSTSDIDPKYIDENGHFKFSITPTAYDDLAGLIHRININRIDNAPVYTSHLQWPLAFNIIMDLIADTYGVKELVAYKIRLHEIDKTINNINDRIKELLLYEFMPFNMGVVSDAEKKLQTIREEFLEIFPYIDNNFFNPTKEAIENTRNFIKEAGNFTTLSPSLAPFHILIGEQN